ncbi:MAG TPA: hypothetical protein VK612_03115 [Pyrinomonadaceae bacterium]|nr:hypothetical protein [Pyrinomonadaceae bacterium]
MNTYTLRVIKKYKDKHILVDTNIALLYIIGSVDPSLIPTTKRTAGFNRGDFEQLSEFIEFFDSRLTPPHVLTEISNLLPDHRNVALGLKTFVQVSNENYEESSALVETESFLPFGLADSAIVKVAEKGVLVLTDDGPLSGHLRSKGMDTLTMADILAI